MELTAVCYCSVAMSPSVRSCFFFGFHVHLRIVYYLVGWKAEQTINKMSLLTDARCFFASIAFSILLGRCDGLGGLIGIVNIQDLPPAEGQIRILLLTLLGIGFLMLLGCLGEFWMKIFCKHLCWLKWRRFPVSFAQDVSAASGGCPRPPLPSRMASMSMPRAPRALCGPLCPKKPPGFWI